MSKYVNPVLAGVLIFIFGFILGSGAMLNSWDAAAQRGMFSVGNKVYRATEVQP